MFLSIHTKILHGNSTNKRTSQELPGIQWLGLQAFTADGLGLIPNWGTQIPQALWHRQKKEFKSTNYKSPLQDVANLRFHFN